MALVTSTIDLSWSDQQLVHKINDKRFSWTTFYSKIEELFVKVKPKTQLGGQKTNNFHVFLIFIYGKLLNHYDKYVNTSYGTTALKSIIISGILRRARQTHAQSLPDYILKVRKKRNSFFKLKLEID